MTRMIEWDDAGFFIAEDKGRKGQPANVWWIAEGHVFDTPPVRKTGTWWDKERAVQEMRAVMGSLSTPYDKQHGMYVYGFYSPDEEDEQESDDAW